MTSLHLLHLADIGPDVAAAVIIRVADDGGLRVEQEWDHGINPLVLARILRDVADRLTMQAPS